MTFDLEKYVPAEVLSGKQRHTYPIQIIRTDDRLVLEYTTTVHNGAGPVGRRIYSHVLPRRISATPESFGIIGLLQGEMSKTVRRSLTFANSEASIMKRVLDWFEHEGLLDRHRWHWYIKLNVPDASYHAGDLLENLTEYWCNQTGIERGMRNPTPLSYVPDSTRRELLNRGTLMIEGGGPLLIQTVQNFVREVTRVVANYPEDALAGYMRGVIAADGCINYRLASHHRRVFICAVKAEERASYRRALEALGVGSSSEREYQVGHHLW